MNLSTYDLSECKDQLLESVFGKGFSPYEKACKYVKGADSRESIIKIEENWPQEWIYFLKKLSIKNPLSAKLAESWARQTRGAGKQEVMYNIPDEGSYPWETKTYWKKERTEQALLQLASRNRQQLIWAGAPDVIGISGGNILLFLFICQHIWDVWIRDNRSTHQERILYLPIINESVQTMGIMNASEEWAKKPKEGEYSTIRLHLIKVLGQHFYNELTNDLAMSYPGKNGFSLKIDDIDQDDFLERLLNFSVEYGDFYEAPHTSKSKGEKRQKYYIAPILCPAHKIPYKHTKEPEYIKPQKLYEWLEPILEKHKVKNTIKQNIETPFFQFSLPFEEGE